METRKFSLVGLLISWIASIIYLASLTSLIPFGALLLTSRPDRIPDTLQYLPYTALALVGVSVLILFIYYRSFAHTLASLGWMTLLPGLASLFFLIFKPEAVLDLLATFVIGFGKIEPLVAAYIGQAVPKLWIFILGYIALGMVLIYIAGKMESEHALTSTVRKLFGPRARIFRSR